MYGTQERSYRKPKTLNHFTLTKSSYPPSVTPEDLAVERKLLMKRKEIINAGTPSNSIRITNLQLFVDRKLINIEEANEVSSKHLTTDERTPHINVQRSKLAIAI